VLNATKTGERSLSPSFVFAADTNPFDALIHGYCDHLVDVFQRPNTRLYSWLKPRLASRQVRGIVLWHFTGCDLWRAEAQTLRESFGLPVLLLEASEEPGNTPRELTRLQAFVETLK
jgi:benzoyl-CoA reductase/2-hydroxyglutaryl-CoA dehydratase subunit BcrC/BadD/HgdB